VALLARDARVSARKRKGRRVLKFLDLIERLARAVTGGTVRPERAFVRVFVTYSAGANGERFTMQRQDGAGAGVFVTFGASQICVATFKRKLWRMGKAVSLLERMRLPVAACAIRAVRALVDILVAGGAILR
jgi:hypothetical protein